MTTRCEELIMQLVVRTYDHEGRPVLERTSTPAKLFRNAKTQDVWAVVDEAVKAMDRKAE